LRRSVLGLAISTGGKSGTEGMAAVVMLTLYAGNIRKSLEGD
jgi:hypothetical protein